MESSLDGASQIKQDGHMTDECSQQCSSTSCIMDCLKALEFKQDRSREDLNRSMAIITAEVRALSHAMQSISNMLSLDEEDPSMLTRWATHDQQTLEPVEKKMSYTDEDANTGEEAFNSTQLQNMIERDSDSKEFYDVLHDLGNVRDPSCLTKAAKMIVASRIFESFIGLIICANLMCVGIAIQQDLDNQDSTAVNILDHVFLVIYVLELVLRFLADGRKCFNSPWVVFDMVLVCLGVSISWIIIPISEAVPGNNATGLAAAKKVLILRFLRMLRLARALRFFTGFQTLWRLVNGVLNSASQIMSTCFLLLVTIYVFSCLGAEIITGESISANWITSQDERLRSAGSIVQDKFRSIPTIMLTLISFVNVDSVSSIYTPLIEARPVLLLYFLPLMLILSITLMNLVTALLVESAIESGKTDKEMKLAFLKKTVNKMAPSIREAFRSLDQNNNGILTRDEIQNKQEDLPPALLELLGPNSMMELFEMLDEDGSGEVHENEFTEGLLKTAVSDVPMETQQMIKLMRINRRKIDKCQDLLNEAFTLLSSKDLLRKTIIFHAQPDGNVSI